METQTSTSEWIDDANDDIDVEYEEERPDETIESQKKTRRKVVHLSNYQKAILDKEMDKYLANKIDSDAMLDLTYRTGLKAAKIKVRIKFHIDKRIHLRI